MKSSINELKSSESFLIQKYEPKSFDELKLPERIQKIIDKNLTRNGYRLIFYGTPGTGKTTTAKLMVKGHEIMYLSGSNDFNINIMRSKVYPFITQKSAFGKTKTLIIDEAENISDKIQDSFKIISDNAKNVNIILITNEIQKINSAIFSRFTKIEYNFSEAELNEQRAYYIKFIQHILVNENIKYDNSGIAELYKINFPDFRSLLVKIQTIIDAEITYIDSNIINNLGDVGQTNVELYELIIKEHDSKKFYESIYKFSGKEKECFLSLSEPFFRYLNNKDMFDITLKAGEIVAKWSNIYVTTFNKFTTFFACCYELKKLFI